MKEKFNALQRNLFEISRLTHVNTSIDERIRALLMIYLENILDIANSYEIELERLRE